MIHYHPSLDLLTEYASGSVTLSKALAVSTHLEHCKHCRDQVRKLEQVGAELFSTPSVPSGVNQLDQLKANLLSKIAIDKQPNNVQVNSASKSTAIEKRHLSAKEHPSLKEQYKVPKSLRQLIPTAYDRLKWMKLSPAVQIATLSNEKDGTQIALTRIKAGAFIPSHTHTGDEYTLVLEGAFSDESGVYKKGDFISRDARHKHKPVVTKDAECICLTITEAPIEFTGWITRLLNPLVRKHHPSAS